MCRRKKKLSCLFISANKLDWSAKRWNNSQKNDDWLKGQDGSSTDRKTVKRMTTG